MHRATALLTIALVALAAWVLYRNRKEGWGSCRPCTSKSLRPSRPCANKAGECCKKSDISVVKVTEKNEDGKEVVKGLREVYKLVECKKIPTPAPVQVGKPVAGGGEGEEDVGPAPKRPRNQEWENEVVNVVNRSKQIFLSSDSKFEVPAPPASLADLEKVLEKGYNLAKHYAMFPVDDHTVKMTVKSAIVPRGAVVKLMRGRWLVTTLRGGKFRSENGVSITGFKAFWEA